MSHQPARPDRSRDSLLLGWELEDRRPEMEPVGFHPPPSVSSKKAAGKAGRPWYSPDGETHLITIAPTGSGKGRGAIIPACLSWPGSLMVIDPKGEAAMTTARRRREMGQEVVVLDPFGVTGEDSASFNPFDIRDHSDMSLEEMSLFLPSLLHPDDSGSLQDPFWDRKADSLIAGVTGYMLTGLEKGDRHLEKMRETLMGGDTVYNLAVALDTVGNLMPKLAYQNLASFTGTDDRCRSGILATAQQHFDIFSDPRTADVLRDTSFCLESFKNGAPMTIYLVLPPGRLQSHKSLLRLWTGALLALVKSRKFRPPLPTLFLIDEAAQLGRMNALVEAVTLLRGYGVRTWSFWQSRRQIEQFYDRDAGTILDNCGVVQCFGLSNFEMASELQSLLGEDWTAKDLLSLPDDRQVVLTKGGNVRLLRKLDYLRDEIFLGHFDANPFYRSSGGIPAQ